MLQDDANDSQLMSLVRKQIVVAIQIVDLTVKLWFKHYLLLKGRRIFFETLDPRAEAGSLEHLVLEIKEMLKKI